MDSGAIRLLVVDDSEDDALLVVRQFRRTGYTVEFLRVDTPAETARALAGGHWDAVIADVNMPSFSAAAALEAYRAARLDVPFLVVSGAVDEEHAVSLLKAGAHDFLLKSSLARLVPAFERERREAGMRQAHRDSVEALRVSEERYALAARGANDGLWDWNLHDGTVYYSARWKEMVGEAEAVVGCSPDEWLHRIHPEDKGRVMAALDEHLDGRTPHFGVEHRIRHSDGGWRWVLVRGAAVTDRTGVPCRLAGSQTDISAHKLAELRLRRAKDELEEAMAAKSRFLAAASHDLRQPVQALFCFTSVLATQLAGERARSTLAELETSLGSLKDLLDALLDVSRLDAGIVEVNPAAFPVQAVLDRIHADMGPVAADKGVKLKVVPSSAKLRSDPVLLARMLRNLVENAIRYTKAGGVVVGVRHGTEGPRIEVWDSGPGIPAEARDKVFQEFFQLGNPERDRQKGLGLGLAIVNRLSRLLDHPVEIRSALGRGSIFAVSVPAAVEASVPQPDLAPAREALPEGGGLVVVIDDEALVAQAFAQLIAAWGFEPLVAGSVDEAMEKVRSLDGGRAPTAIVADYRLRDGQTGTQAIAGIRSLLGRPIPSLVVTGDTAAERLREFGAAGAMVLHKPVAAAELRRALGELMREGRA
ncbi:MAG: ATP-binding protein [Actinomycetota bacterium]